MMHYKASRLSAVALGVSLGFLCAIWMLIIALVAAKGNAAAMDMVNKWATVLPGINTTPMGIAVATAWGFLKGFICGLILGWIYNLCLCCCSRRGCCGKCEPNKCCCGKCSYTSTTIEPKL